jgi:hypothetical protein
MEKLYIKFSDINMIQRKSDFAWIPICSDNLDYQRYIELCEQYGESEITEVQ